MTEELSDARQRRRSRYDRPRSYISWFALILGLILGIGGALYYTWEIDQVEEVDIAPWQLNNDDRNSYLVAIMLDYAYRNNLTETIQRLVDLQLPGNDPIQQVAVIACDMARAGYVNSNAGLTAIRTMMTFYQNQGKSGCADELLPVVALEPTREIRTILPTATLRPPASKTPTPPGTVQPTDTPTPGSSPTALPGSDFDVVNVQTYCDAELPGLIEVFVVDFNGQGIPGQPVRVRWNGGESQFYSGLKPERGPGYADFQMEEGLAYSIEMPRLSDPYGTPLEADSCNLEEGGTAITSYRVTFRGG